VHPGSQPILKSYGYVGNAAEWFIRLLDAPADAVHRRMFYFADERMDSRAWMNAFARALTGQDVRVVPRTVWRLLARGGDIAASLGLPAPMNSDRLYRMTTEDVVSSEPTRALLGSGPVPFDEAIRITTRWCKDRAAGNAAVAVASPVGAAGQEAPR
jgi:hypothetical protein